MSTINDIRYEGVLPTKPRGDCPRLGIVGCGRNMWDDLARFYKFDVQCDIMTVNLSGLFFPKPSEAGGCIHRFMVAMDGGNVQFIKGLRQIKYHEPIVNYVSISVEKPADYVVDFPDVYPIAWTAVYGALLARVMDYRRIVLIGCPHDNSGHFYDPPWGRTPTFNSCEVHREAWTVNERYWKGTLRSMSGKTREWLGEPTREWLLEEE